MKRYRKPRKPVVIFKFSKKKKRKTNTKHKLFEKK